MLYIGLCRISAISRRAPFDHIGTPDLPGRNEFSRSLRVTGTDYCRNLVQEVTGSKTVVHGASHSKPRG